MFRSLVDAVLERRAYEQAMQTPLVDHCACGRRLTEQNRSGVCNQCQEGANKVCSVCDSPVGRYNRSGLCPPCLKARKLHRKLERERANARHCACGKRLGRHNATGLCSSCAHRARLSKDVPRCGCGRRLRRDNPTGRCYYCNRTKVCACGKVIRSSRLSCARCRYEIAKAAARLCACGRRLRRDNLTGQCKHCARHGIPVRPEQVRQRFEEFRRQRQC